MVIRRLEQKVRMENEKKFENSNTYQTGLHKSQLPHQDFTDFVLKKERGRSEKVKKNYHFSLFDQTYFWP